MLEREEMRLDVVRGDLRLRRGTDRRVTEVWVRWHAQPHFYFSGPEDRHYVIDRHGGRIFFGDGKEWRIPPAGATILARESRTGGGLEGNVPERAINQLLSDVPGVEAICNPRPAEGGADGESLASVSGRGSFTIRAGTRAINWRIMQRWRAKLGRGQDAHSGKPRRRRPVRPRLGSPCRLFPTAMTPGYNLLLGCVNMFAGLSRSMRLRKWRSHNRSL